MVMSKPAMLSGSRINLKFKKAYAKK